VRDNLLARLQPPVLIFSNLYHGQIRGSP